MDFLECNVCLNQYNDDDRRPRALLCGHTYCSDCIDKYIDGQQIFRCPTCRKSHTISSASDFPPNYDLQDAVQHFKSSDATNDPEEDNKVTLKVCPHHNTCRLYFHCLSHDEAVCRECTVLRHPRGECKLIPAALANDKQLSISCVEAQYTKAGETISNLTTEKETKEQQIKALAEQLKQLSQDHKSIEVTISKFGAHREHLARVKEELMCVKNVEDLQKSSELVVKHLHDTLQLLASIKEHMEVWAVQTKAGEERYAQLSIQDNQLYLHVLRDDEPYHPTRLEDAVKLPYSALRDALHQDSPLCFLEIGYKTSNPGNTLGRIHLRLDGEGDRAQQFRLLCTGEMGPSYHNCNFSGVKKRGELGMSLVGGNYDGRSAEALIPISFNECLKPIKAGLLSGVFQNDSSTNALFEIYTSGLPGFMDKITFGHLEDDLGLAVVIAATEQEDVKEIKILDCGVVIGNNNNRTEGLAVDIVTHM